MNKKVLLLSIIFSILSLGAIGFFFYDLFSSPKETVIINDSRMDALHAVPSDAIMIYDFNTLADLKAGINQKESSMFAFISLLPKESDEWGTLYSLHYSSKNEVSLLFVLSLPQELDKASFLNSLSKECEGITHKKYGDNIIVRSIVPDINFVIDGNFLLASSSVIILESSIRHLEGNTSIKDNPLFVKMSEETSGTSSIHFSNQNIGKLFSGTVTSRFLSYADFAGNFSNWMMLNLDVAPNYLFGEGSLLNVKDEANFSNIFKLQKPKESKVFGVLPYNTNYVVTLPLYSDKAYIESYKSYLEARKKINNYNYLNAMAKKGIASDLSPLNWFLSLGVEEIAKAALPVKEGNEAVILMKIKNTAAVKDLKKEVNKFQYQGYIPTLLGDFFTPTSDEFFCINSNWMIVGSKGAVELFASFANSENFFSFENFLLQTPSAASCKGNVSLSAVINLSRCKDSIAVIFKPDYSGYLLKGIEKHNFNFITLKITPESGKIKVLSSIFIDNLAELPSLKKSSTEVVEIDNSSIIPPSGPFAITNFITGKTNYLEQLPNNSLRLLDDNHKGIWTIPFDGKLCGYVSNIDLFKNGKMQMLFASGSKFYLLDRLGRWVSSFPVDLKKEITLGPLVFDFSSNREYSIMCLHPDNTIGMYDIKGKALPNWTFITTEERIRSFPEVLNVGTNRYWVLRTPYQTKIFNSSGAIVADFTKKKRLKPDTEIKINSDSDVMVTTIEDKEMILNLATGSFKKP